MSWLWTSEEKFNLNIRVEKLCLLATDTGSKLNNAEGVKNAPACCPSALW
jgi:hypothetical protein